MIQGEYYGEALVMDSLGNTADVQTIDEIVIDGHVYHVDSRLKADIEKLQRKAGRMNADGMVMDNYSSNPIPPSRVESPRARNFNANNLTPREKQEQMAKLGNAQQQYLAVLEARNRESYMDKWRNKFTPKDQSSPYASHNPVRYAGMGNSYEAHYQKFSRR